MSIGIAQHLIYALLAAASAVAAATLMPPTSAETMYFNGDDSSSSSSDGFNQSLWSSLSSASLSSEITEPISDVMNNMETAASVPAVDIQSLSLEQIMWFQQNISKMFNISVDNVTSLLITAQQQSQRDPLPLVITFTVFFAIITIAGLLGNLITCIVISRNKFMHTATNFYLFNLAVSDLILLVSGMPQELYSLWYPDSYPFTDSFCVMESILSETAANATVLTITAFTVERYIAICHPFRQHTMSRLSRAIKFIFAIWIMAFLLALPQAMQFSVEKNEASCTIGNNFYAHVFAVSGFIFFGGPMTAICVLYVLIGVKLKRSRLLQAVPRRCYDVNRGISAQTRVIRMLVAVAVAFFICWAPFHAQRLMAVYGSSNAIESQLFNDIYHILHYTSGILYFLSTCINPLLYNIMSHKFRDAFKVTLSRHFGFSNTYQTQTHNYSALLRQNGSMRLNTTVNNNALEHLNSYRIVQLQCRDPSHHLSLQDSIRTTTTTTTINSGQCPSGNGAGIGVGTGVGMGIGGVNGGSGVGRNRCVSVGSQSTLMTSLSKNDVFAGNNVPRRATMAADGLPHRLLQTQISQLSSVGDANSLLDSEMGSAYHHAGHPHPMTSYRLKELRRLKGSSMNAQQPMRVHQGRSLTKTADDCESYNSQEWDDDEPNMDLGLGGSDNETDLFTKPVVPVAPQIVSAQQQQQQQQPVQQMNSIAELSGATQPSRARLKLSRIITRRDQDAIMAHASPRVELMRSPYSSPTNESNGRHKMLGSGRDLNSLKAKTKNAGGRKSGGKTLDGLIEKLRWRPRRKMPGPGTHQAHQAASNNGKRIRQESSSSTSSTSTPPPRATFMRMVYPRGAGGTKSTETALDSDVPLRSDSSGQETTTPEAS